MERLRANDRCIAALADLESGAVGRTPIYPLSEVGYVCGQRSDIHARGQGALVHGLASFGAELG